MQQVREDFDRIATLSEHEAESRVFDLAQLARLVPANCDHLLEVGCGFGEFTRLAARRAQHVTALDLSPQMIRVARERSREYQNLEFVLGDFLEQDLKPETFDCIVTIATLHHLPTHEAVLKMKALLKPGGVLIIRDLLGPSGPLDRAFDGVRLPLSMAARLWKTGRLRSRRELRRAWLEHGAHDRYLTIKEARQLRDELLPGAFLRRHLFWRYTLIWRQRPA